MQSPVLSPASTQDVALQDLGPLAWVLEELRKSLDASAKSLKRFVREAQAAIGSDLATLDANHLRLARQQLHQAAGALEMIDQAGPATLLHAMEAAVQRFIERPELCTPAAAVSIEAASFALTEYLEAQLAGKQISPVALFPQYRDVQQLAGADRIHPADLWAQEWEWREPAVTLPAMAQSYAGASRTTLDTAMLDILRGRPSASSLDDFCLALAKGCEEPRQRIFWKLAAAFFQALGSGQLTIDLHAKRAASRVLLQFSTLQKGQAGVSDRLAQDLLFFCAQTGPVGADAQALLAVRAAYGLDRFRPVNYDAVQFGRFDPALLAQARKRIGLAKETWSALAGGDTSKLRLVSDQFSQVADSLVKLYPASEPLAQALTQAARATAQSASVPPVALAMEVATSVLYLEAAFADLDPDDAHLKGRTQHLVERLQAVSAGKPAQPLEQWMEDLYRRVSDKQTMGSVVGELRLTLSDIEKSLDLYFRDTSAKAVLQNVPHQLHQMRGVLSVLGLDQAAEAVLQMHGSVETLAMSAGAQDPAQPADATSSAASFEKLGTNLGALSFLIDMLSYQPDLARKLFVYDRGAQELKPLMGRRDKLAPAAEASDGNALGLVAGSAQARLDAADQAGSRADFTLRLDELAASAALADQPDLARAARQASLAVAAEDNTAAVAALESLAGAVPPPHVPALPEALPAVEEDDLQDIFLEEARSVFVTANEALQALQTAPSEHEPKMVLRRAFHTLKGSSRMVGLEEFGRAAWALERLLNGWLAEQKPATPALHALCAQTLERFSAWVEDIAARKDASWSAEPFISSAAAMAERGVFEEFQAPAPVESAAPAAPVASVDLLATAAALPSVASPASAAMDFDFDLSEADFPAVSAPVAALPALPSDIELLEIDLSALDDLTSPAPGVAEPTPVPAAPNVTPVAASYAGFDFDLELDAPVGGEPLELSEDDFDAHFAAPVQAMAPPVPPADISLDLAGPQDVPDSAEALRAALAPLTHLDLDLSAPREMLPEASAEALFDPSQSPVQSPAQVSAAELDAQMIARLSGLQVADDAPVAGSVATGASAFPPLDLDLDLDLDLNLDFPLDAPATANTPSAPAVPTVDSSAEQPETFLELDTSDNDEHVKVIGSLKIGLPLYNVFLNEADEWSRRLVTELTEWTLDAQNQPVADSTVALAHSLAGSSATVGFAALSEVARALEQALQQAQAHPWADQASWGPLFVDTAEDIRRLLHQFAAGFLKEPNARLLAGLSELDFTEPTPSRLAALQDEWALQEETVQDIPPLRRPSAELRSVADLVDERDDEIDAVDAIDGDLFPIFEEEGAELLPQLGGSLRQWAARPDNLSARSEILRVLHTLKGSARLAGALRLGEMAHQLESDVEGLDQHAHDGAASDRLLHRFDVMQATFEALRHADLQAGDAAASHPAEDEEAGQAPADRINVLPVLDEVAGVLDPDAIPGVAALLAAPESATRKIAMPLTQGLVAQPVRQVAGASIRVRSQLLDRMVNQAGEVMITRSRLEAELGNLRSSLGDMTGNLNRLRQQLRDIEVQAEGQMQSRLAQAKEAKQGFDPLEFDRFTRVQELTRMMAESVNDVATVQRTLQRTVEATEDDLVAQARQTRELQRDLLRTRMVEFDGIADRLYRVVRLASKETGKQVRLDLTGGTIEMDRGTLDRMTPAFEHLLRNCVAHGIESPESRLAAGKDPVGLISVSLHQEGNDVSVQFSDDGAGLNLEAIRRKALSLNLVGPDDAITEAEAANLIFMPGFSTASQVTELAGRGIGMDVVRAEVNALGGRIETTSVPGNGTRFKLVLPLTTAVTQVVMLRAGNLSVGLPANVVETVRRATPKEVQQAYNTGTLEVAGESVPFFWAGALLQGSQRSLEPQGRTLSVVVCRSAAQRIALHVDEVLGNKEVVVKNLGPQLSRLAGLAGMSVLASGAVVLIYNPVALAAVYGAQAHAWSADSAQPHMLEGQAGTPMAALPDAPSVPLVLVVDDSITVRRVTQRLLQREGYRVALAADGLQALELLRNEAPSVVLSDIEMPRMDGFDLLRNIRSDVRLGKLPVIMITSRIAEKHREYARELGVDHYLGKPYPEEELLSLVRRYCEAAVAV
ncbi:MAG: Hpt domain-containing protein [Pseudomonadota bacterium]